MEQIEKRKEGRAHLIARLLIYAEYVIHLLVAIMLIIATFNIFGQTFNDTIFNQELSVKLISNALLMMIVKEVLWSVIKFFKKQSFGISSFLFIGIISSIREMLYLEVQKSMEKTQSFELTMELGINALIIAVLVFSYFLLQKSDKNKE